MPVKDSIDQSKEKCLEQQKEIAAIFHSIWDTVDQESKENTFKKYINSFNQNSENGLEIRKALETLKHNLNFECSLRFDSTNHPVRVAQALDKLLSTSMDESELLSCLENFQKQVDDSTLYPNTKMAACLILYVLLAFLLLIPTMGIGTAVMLAIATEGGPKCITSMYDDILNSQNTGKKLHGLFSYISRKNSSSTRDEQQDKETLISSTP